MKKLHYYLLVAILTSVFSSGELYAVDQICTSGADCVADTACIVPDGLCGGKGLCKARPAACDRSWAPVCGCDGVTYGNRCEADAAGVSVVFEGECRPERCGLCTSNADCGAGTVCNAPDVCLPPCDAPQLTVCAGYCVPADRACTSNADCTVKEFCKKEPGMCSAQGVCSPRQPICPDVWLPVCGCDGRTYGNACEASAAGVSILKDGPCTETECFDGTDNDRDGLPDCQDPDCLGVTDGECRTELPGICATGVLTCTATGELCLPRIEPGSETEICGNDVDENCDGRIDENCECRGNEECGTGQFCDKALGECRGIGKCRDIPQGCPDVWDPVCGCDGRTYGNACEAAAAGMTAAHEGECMSGGYYCDMDKDKYISDSPVVFVCSPEICGPSDCQRVPGDDCDDGNAGINPAAEEVCDRIDNNCNGVIDEGCECRINADCDPAYFCSKPPEGCDNPGICRERPNGCTKEWNPVCGCDGRTYGNPCMAAAAGVSVAHAGTCKEVQCFDGIDNDFDEMTDCKDPDCIGQTDGECRTGLPGICETGILTCTDAGEVCVPRITPGEEREICNGLDDDCDGEIDEIDPVPPCVDYNLNLNKGFNLVGGHCVPAGMTSFKLLERLGGKDIVISIQRYDHVAGEFETAAYEEGIPSGVDFPLRDGEGYIIHMNKDLIHRLH